MSRKKIFLLFLVVSCCGCMNKKTAENELKIEINIEESPINEKLYVAPPDGLNLRSSYGITGEKIKLLPQNAELTVLERSEEKETIDGIHDYWYRVDTGDETGWVFGGYLSREPIDNKIKDVQIPKFISDREIVKFGNGLIWYIDGAIEYYNNDTMKVYEENTKESSYFLIDSKIVYLIKIEETPSWFYLISNDDKIHGFVNIYDISEESVYGSFGKKRSNKEYIILNQHQNIKRYGPLLTINHNGRKIDFWNTFSGKPGGKQYFLVDYFPAHNEILMYEQYYEGGTHFIYNLESEEVRCKSIKLPYFNESRTFFLTYGWESEALSATLRIFRINNGFYDEIAQKNIYVDQFYFYSINSIIWINDREAHIDCGEVGVIIVKIGDEINVINNSVTMKIW